MTSDQVWDDECDVLVVGSGAGALAGALVAATNGLSTMLIEKTEFFGGTTAYSGGGMWLPNNAVELRAGVPDTKELARDYVTATVGKRTPTSLQDAFLDAAPKVISFLEENPRFEFEWRPFPDYYAVESGFPDGRSIYALELTKAELGGFFDQLRPPLWPVTDTVHGGRALLGRLLLALGDTDADLRRNTALDRLIVEDGAVIGVEAVTAGSRIRIKARRGVLLACGGFESNDTMRHQFQGELGSAWTMGSPGNTGDALRAGLDIGASTDLLEECWWSPGLLQPDGSAAFMIGIAGGIIVNSAGERFANEALPYDRFGHEILKGHATGVSHIPAFLITDQRLIETHGVPGIPRGIPAGHPIDDDWFSSGVLKRADTLEELAVEIGVPAAALRASVEQFNGFAKTGVDEAFHRGDEPFDQFFGVPSEYPNPTLKPIETGPYYAATIVPADLGTKGGLRCDGNARVLNEQGAPIAGLYAAGNTMASWTGHVYPGPGSPIGSCLVFSFLAAHDMLNRQGV